VNRSPKSLLKLAVSAITRGFGTPLTTVPSPVPTSAKASSGDGKPRKGMRPMADRWYNKPDRSFEQAKAELEAQRLVAFRQRINKDPTPLRKDFEARLAKNRAEARAATAGKRFDAIAEEVMYNGAGSLPVRGDKS